MSNPDIAAIIKRLDTIWQRIATNNARMTHTEMAQACAQYARAYQAGASALARERKRASERVKPSFDPRQAGALQEVCQHQACKYRARGSGQQEACQHATVCKYRANEPGSKKRAKGRGRTVTLERA